MRCPILLVALAAPCVWSLTIPDKTASPAGLEPQPPANSGGVPAKQQKAFNAQKLMDMMPMLYQEWALATPQQDFPLDFPADFNFLASGPPVLPIAGAPPAEPPTRAVVTYPGYEAKPKANNTQPAVKPSRWITPEIAGAPKCQIPKNLSFCKGVDYPVPYFGWTEWEAYVDKSLRFNLESAFTETDEELSDTYIFHPLTRGKEHQCAQAMKAIGCSVYFPKCDPGKADKVMKPCKHLCVSFVETLECPAFEGSVVDLYDCRTANTTSPAYSGSGKCTDYSDEVVPDEPEAPRE